jgi:plasmid stabilization system protein ParE
MRVRFHPAAAAEFERAQAWYEERSVFAAAGFVQELTRTVQRIRIAPERYPSAEHGTRRIVVEQYPFTAFYVTRVTRALSLPSPITSDVLVIGRLVLGCPSSQKRGWWGDRSSRPECAPSCPKCLQNAGRTQWTRANSSRRPCGRNFLSVRRLRPEAARHHQLRKTR